MTLRIFALFTIITVGACSQLSSVATEQQILEDAVAALGGRSSIEAAKTLMIEAEGVQGNLGQDMTPEATSQSFTISSYKQFTDLKAGRMRIHLTRKPNYDYYRGPAAMDQVFGVDGDVAYNVAADKSVRRASKGRALELRRDYLHHPVRLLHAAIQPGAKLANARTEDGKNLVDITTASDLTFTLAIDASTKLPAYVVSHENHSVLRDVSMKTSFTEYKDVSGLKLPTHIVQTIDDYQLLDLKVTAQTVNGEAVDLAAPESVKTAELNAPPSEVKVEKLADGVWFFAGPYNSVLVEFSDHLLLFETPNETRTLALVAKARELVPGKPLTHVVNTHHHFDHSGGVRAAISEGFSVITQKANASFYEQLAKRASTKTPDVLSKNSKSAKIVAVEGKLVHEDKSMKVEFYHIADNPHSNSLIMMYLPKQKILVEADAYSPGRPLQPFATNLLANIKRLNLQIDRILPVHGKIATYDDLVRDVKKMSDAPKASAASK